MKAIVSLTRLIEAILSYLSTLPDLDVIDRSLPLVWLFTMANGNNELDPTAPRHMRTPGRCRL